MKRIIKDNEKNRTRYLFLTSEILNGRSKSLSIYDEKGFREDMAEFSSNGKYHAISDTCPHKGGPLSQGILK